MKTAIYCRVSTKEQTTGNQKIRLEEYAKRNNWQYDIYEEVMSSRKTRPKKQEVLRRLRNKEYDAVLVWKLDRWARSSQELSLEIEELYKKGIMFISLSDNIDLSTATGKLQFQILSAFAEFERNLIRERTLEGLRRAKMQGKRLGRPKGSKDTKRRKRGGYYLRYNKSNNTPM
jgi:DNA invertase Pin-like site-specific DNA recombinase